ncbi:MAG TPA: methyltransferase [Roseiarcus sp.]|nr:methyltransferase [Roseiarcus sp.]
MPEERAEAIGEFSLDLWLGGKLKLVQSKSGHRAGSDAALLAAALDLVEGRIVDVGAGVGAVGLALALRSERLSVDLVEIDLGLARFAADNAARNGQAKRVRALKLDVLDARARREAGLNDNAANAVVTNPPFYAPGSVRVSPDPDRARAHVHAEARTTGAPLVDWIRACLAIVRPGGAFAMIHRPEALATILEAAENRLGALALLPVHPRLGASAHRLLISGIKGSRAPLRIAPALLLHGPDGRFTPEADAIHRGEALVDWGV